MVCFEIGEEFMKTQSVKIGDIKKEWLVVDAANQPLGRMASQVAYILRGKHKPSYVPHLDCGDNVIVINAEKVKLTGLKWENKLYYRHSNYIGGIKSTRAKDLRETYPDRIIVSAVKGMLPHNKLGRKVLKNLKIYSGDQHPHVPQKPQPALARTMGKGEN